jgi:hypothetical protein
MEIPKLERYRDDLWKDIEIPTEPTKIDETLLKDLLAVSRERFNLQTDTCTVGQNASVSV